MMPRMCGVLLFVLASVSTAFCAPLSPRVDEFRLTDDRGQPWSWHQVRGRVVLVAFGYTSCPDVCPLTLNLMAQSLSRLGGAADKVQTLFISVDGERDSPEILHQYVRHFDPRILGLTGSSEEIQTAGRCFKASYKLRATAAGAYLVDHTANLFLVDPDGRIAAIIPFGFPVEHVVSLLEAELGRGPDAGR